MASNEPTAAAAIEQPKCIAILICNEIIEDKQTNNKTLVSLFNTIATQEVPFTQPRMFIMASFINGQGKWPLTFRITSPAGDAIVEIKGEPEFFDPLVVVDVVFDLRGIRFPETGTYCVDVLAGSAPLQERRIQVVLTQGANA